MRSFESQAKTFELQVTEVRSIFIFKNKYYIGDLCLFM